MSPATSATSEAGAHALAGVLLAAGHSTRMGRDKALLEVDGGPLWQRQRDLLAASGATEIFLSARPEQRWAREAKGFTAVVHDAFSRGGPLVGVTAGLERSTCPWIAVVAIDLPRISPPWFHALRRECGPGFGVVGRRGKYFEPLAAIYPRELLPLAWEALVRGEYSLQTLLGAAVDRGLMRPREIAADEAGQFENWNEGAGFSILDS